MKTVFHKADSRGHANHGWLDSHHTFSFADYQNTDRMNFGVLRVLNDDVVSEARGFGTHPHRNMEIISIPLEGDLQHMDNMGNSTVIKQGDVQVMSAGTGIQHSEYNKNKDRPVKFLQIWIIPNKIDVDPRYDQVSLKEIETKNAFYQILSPFPEDQGVWIHQDAWFHMGDFDPDKEATYTLKKKGNGVYVFVLEGALEVNGKVVHKRDGYGLWDIDRFDIKTIEPSEVLLMEVPMSL
ncbi:MAG: pirin family protein [Maribacter sp.]|uniref:pirin family protein n=1 Tax=Maribacter sp. TaxID=1897614 RepID=UPI003C728339